MRIGLLAPPFVRVPPERYGGTERVVAALADGLVERGHEVVLFASGDSHTKARLEPIVDSPVWENPKFNDNGPFWMLAVDRAYRNADGLELMHNHADFYAYPLARRAPMPTVTTQHWRMDMPELVPLYEEYAEHPLIAVSDAQRQPLPTANWLATVHHGLPRHLYRPKFERGRYLVFCGRLSRDKGVHVAIEAAIRTGIPIRIAGRRPTGLRTDAEARAERDYFEHILAPLLRDPLVEELGEIGEAEKQSLYEDGMALLFPINWPEPFGLVLIESLACGTPVLASPVGSVPEVIRDGVAGYHCSTVDDYVRAIERIDAIDRSACRREFDERFTAALMARRYEETFARFLGTREAPTRLRTIVKAVPREPTPTAVRGTSALDLAPEPDIEPQEWRRYTRHAREILEAFGLPLDTPGTRGTPERFLGALYEATRGIEGDPKLRTVFPNEAGDAEHRSDQIVEGPIRFYSLCEHHALPFFGDAHVGYVPGRELIGLSKLTRLVRLHARRFTLQERLAADIADDLARLTHASGVAVRLEATHLCTQMRGVGEASSVTRTTAWRGAYESSPELREEFLGLCRIDSTSA
jgi:GTP cyclohydrolase I